MQNILVTLTSPKGPTITQTLMKPDKGPAKINVPSGYRMTLVIQAPEGYVTDKIKATPPKLVFKKASKNLVVLGDDEPLVEVVRYFATPDVGVESVSWEAPAPMAQATSASSSAFDAGNADANPGKAAEQVGKTKTSVEGIAAMQTSEVVAAAPALPEAKTDTVMPKIANGFTSGILSPSIAGLGVLSAMGVGGGDNAPATTTQSTQTAAGSVFKVSLALGPTTDGGTGTTFKFYKADGTVIAGSGKFAADGSYTFTAKETYTGKLFVQVSDGDSSADFMDEKTGLATNIGTTMWVSTDVSSSSGATLVASPLSTLALAKALKVSTLSEVLTAVTGNKAATADVVASNKAIAKLFDMGSVDLATESVQFAIDTAGQATTSINPYGKALLVLSNYNTSPSTTITDLLPVLSVNGTTASLLTGTVATALKTAATTPYIAYSTAPMTFKSSVLQNLATVTDTTAPAFDASVVTLAASPIQFVENTSGVVFTASATDAFGVKTYAFETGTDEALFNINASTGAVSFKSSPDFETPLSIDANNKNKYVVKVKATDSNGNATTTPLTFTINVTDVDDTAPVFKAGATRTVKYVENSTGPVIAAANKASELATDAVGVTKYSFAAGVDDGKFLLNSETGELRFKAVPDYENPLNANNTYTVKIRAEDAKGNSSVQTVTINVVDVVDGNQVADNTAPQFKDPNNTATVVTTASVDYANKGTSVVYSPVATDNVGVAKFELAGTDAATFNIDSSTGVVSFKTPPNLNATTAYSLTIKALDAANNATSLALTVNVAVDSTAPVIQRAEAHWAGGQVLLTYSESLSATTALKGQFSINIDGVVYTPAAVSVSGPTVTLNLPMTLTYGQDVSVSYSPPTADAANTNNAIQDTTGNDALALSNYSVNTTTIWDTSAPSLQSAQTSADGTKVILTFSEVLNAVTSADKSRFAVKVNDSAGTIQTATVVGKTIELTLASAVTSGQSVTVSYTDPSTSNDTYAVQDKAGNDASSFTDWGVTNAVLDTTAPTQPTAATSTDGQQIILTFNEALSSNTPGTGQFVVKVGDAVVTVRSVAIDSSNNKNLLLTLENRVAKNAVVKVTYTDPTANSNDAYNAIQDMAGNDVASFSDLTVTTSNAPDADTAAPTLSSAATSSSGNRVTLTFSEDLNLTTAEASRFTVKVAGTAVSVSQLVLNGKTIDLLLSKAVKAGETVTVSYDDPSANNDTAAVQDLSGNDAASFTDFVVTNGVTPTTFNISTVAVGTTGVVWTGAAADTLSISQNNSYTKLNWNSTSPSKLDIRTGAAAASGKTVLDGTWDSDGTWYQASLSDMGTITLSNYAMAWVSLAGMTHAVTLNLQARQQAWVVGTDQADTINVGTDAVGSGNDTIEAGKGDDVININTTLANNGRTTLKLGNYIPTDAIGGNGVDVVSGFKTNKNSTVDSGDDVIDLSALFSGKAITTQNLSSYLSLSNDGSDTTLKIDRDGTGLTYNGMSTLMTLKGLILSDADLQMLHASGQLKLGNAQTVDTISTGATSTWTGDVKDSLSLSQTNSYTKLGWDSAAGGKLTIRTGSADAPGYSTLGANWDTKGDWFTGTMTEAGVVSLNNYAKAWVDLSGMGHAMALNLNAAKESWVKGTAYNDIINVGSDLAGTGSDTIRGGQGTDTININAVSGINGKTTLVYTPEDLTGGGVDLINGFNTDKNSTLSSSEDIIDLSALFSSQTINTGNLSNYVTATVTAGNTTLSVDRDGTGTSFGSTAVLTLNNVSLTASDLQNMLTAGQLKVLV